MKKFKLYVYIGHCFSYGNPQSICCACLDNGFFLPGHKRIVEFANIYHLGTYVADFCDFIKKYFDKKVISGVQTIIHLNVKTNKKTFYDYDAVKEIDKINKMYTAQLRDF